MTNYRHLLDEAGVVVNYQDTTEGNVTQPGHGSLSGCKGTEAL